MAKPKSKANKSKKLQYQIDLWSLLNPINLVKFAFTLAYVLVQSVLIALFKSRPPKSRSFKPRGRIAVIGAGLTGVSSAAHAIAHGFEVVIYEAAEGPHPGGIWSNVNKTSGLQINSIIYRFHPGVLWRNAFPQKKEIVKEITRIWKEFHLRKRTRFNTRVTSVTRAESSSEVSKGGHGRWIINDGADGEFDAVIVAVGTCGKPRWMNIEGMPKRQANQKNSGANNAPSYADKLKEGLPQENSSSSLYDGTSFADKLKEGLPQDDSSSSPYDGTSFADKDKDGLPQEDSTSSVSEGSSFADKVKGTTFDDDSKGQETDESKGDLFTGPIMHSSQLDSAEEGIFRGKTVAIAGGGASAVEAAETVLALGATKCVIIAREDKWIIPRNIIFDTLVACQPFGRQMPLSFLWERYLKTFHYHGAARSLIPQDRGLFEGTPIVNNKFLNHVRAGKCEYLRGSVTRLRNGAVIFEEVSKSKENGGQNNADEKKEGGEVQADVVVLATGFEKPSIDFLPKDLFPEGYERPDLYLQNFSTEDWSILMTNSAYKNAIGTVGHFHIGIYTRILLTLLMDRGARPTPKDMKLWVDTVRFIKRGARGGALGFFTYAELCIWLVGFHLLRPDRLKWLFFIMLGWGVHPLAN
jgi:cation diffusion facilitator CzcD-associated flavoprotein CzcO